jgi:hypothetical protein
LAIKPFAKNAFRPSAWLCSKFYPRDINYTCGKIIRMP